MGIDDFALGRSREYAIVLIDADTGQRIEVVPGRGAKRSPTGCESIPG
ncbi:MAG: hypothetical protein KIT69_13960 [Propionibacteriaceae bacterium]|nr:hypothetical protein [Propionibacteriaceae bacterium]